MIWWRLAIRDLINNRKFSLFFILNLSLGLGGFVALDAFKGALSSAIDNQSRSVLASDLTVVSKRPLNREERATLDRLLPAPREESRSISLYSMAAGKGLSRLVQVKSIDDKFPFYGEILLGDQKKAGGAENNGLQKQSQAWVYPELLPQLGIQLGESLQIGEAKFRVVNTVEKDPANLWSGVAMAPRIYVGLDQLDATQLIRPGSTVYYVSLFKLPKGTDVESLSKALFQAFSDPGIWVNTPRTASRQLGRLLGYLNDFLGLVALVALFLAGIGAAFLYRSYLDQQLKPLAIMMSLGVQRNSAQTIYLIELLILGVLATLPALAAATFILPWLGRVGEALLPLPLELSISTRSAAVVIAMGVGASLLICYPILQRIRNLSPATILQEFTQVSLPVSKGHWLAFVPAFVLYWLLAVWQAHSFKVAGLFIAIFFGSALVLWGVGWGFLKTLESRLRTGYFIVKIAIRNLCRRRAATLTCFLALSLGALLVNLIPQIHASLEAEMEAPEGSRLPAFFLFDIQEEQLDPLKKYVDGVGGRLQQVSPLVRARLEKVNGVKFEKGDGEEAFTREENQERRFKNRSYNLSYRRKLASSESIVSGRPFSGAFDSQKEGFAEISVEQRFAKRLGFSIGDTLSFDVQGVEVIGKVVNLRRVKWTSFDPNFFVQFQDGVLNEAPKTFLASLGNLPKDRKAEIQTGIVRKFSNVSMVDVSRLVGRILSIVEKISWALKFMAYLSLLAGFLVLFSIAYHQANLRKAEINLLKILGSSFGEVRSILVLESFLLGFLAVLFGGALALLASYVVSTILFDNLWIWNGRILVMSGVGIVCLSVFLSLLATQRVLRQKPLALLQSSQH